MVNIKHSSWTFMIHKMVCAMYEPQQPPTVCATKKHKCIIDVSRKLVQTLPKYSNLIANK